MNDGAVITDEFITCGQDTNTYLLFYFTQTLISCSKQTSNDL